MRILFTIAILLNFTYYTQALDYKCKTVDKALQFEMTKNKQSNNYSVRFLNNKRYRGVQQLALFKNVYPSSVDEFVEFDMSPKSENANLLDYEGLLKWNWKSIKRISVEISLPFFPDIAETIEDVIVGRMFITNQNDTETEIIIYCYGSI